MSNPEGEQSRKILIWAVGSLALTAVIAPGLIWFGEEPEIPGYGIWFEPADLPAVSNVLSVREQSFDAESPWAFDIVADVVFRDGTQAEVVLEPVPYGE